MMKKLEVSDLVKTFGTIVANDHVDFDVKDQEVHCILGENGAGKTTLMNCIYGILPPDSGEIFYEGERFTHHTIADSIKKGIGMVHQHFMLVHNMTVLENVMLGLKSSREPFIEKKKVASELLKIMDIFRISVNLDEEIRNLSVGAQQSVEILKALYRNSRLLIMDEPTAVLTPDEIQSLFLFIRQYVKNGNSVVLITHKLEEILDISDRITVMRSGRNVDTFQREEIKDKHELAAKMVGEDIELSLRNKTRSSGETCIVLRIENLTVEDNRGLKAVDDVSLEVREGEILGIAGVSGNGQTELAETIAAIRRPLSGTISIAGKPVADYNVRKMQLRGLRYIPEDRHKYGLVLKFSVKDNLLLTHYYEKPYVKKGKLDHRHNNTFAKRMIEEYHVITYGINALADQLSGGNQQKLILARELATQPMVLIASQPTRGLDVAATRFVQDVILRQKERGTAVLYISTALDEVIDMSDRVAVMYKGRIVGIFDAREADSKKIGALMAGTYDITRLTTLST